MLNHTKEDYDDDEFMKVASISCGSLTMCTVPQASALQCAR